MNPYERLEVLRRLGANGFDRPAFRFIESLLQRATEMEGAREQLEARARQRLATLEAALRTSRAEAEAALGAVCAAGSARADELEALFARGAFREVTLEARRALATVEPVDGGALPRLRRLQRRAMAQGLALPAEVQADVEQTLQGSDELHARALGDELARALFKDAAQQAKAVLVVARASDRVAEDVGPYNPDSLTAQTLSLIESLAPGYLRTSLAGLEDLAALRRLPEPKKQPRRR